jgi:hypothetical protein
MRGPFIKSARVNYRQRNRNTFELLQNYVHKMNACPVGYPVYPALDHWNVIREYDRGFGEGSHIVGVNSAVELFSPKLV